MYNVEYKYSKEERQAFEKEMFFDPRRIACDPDSHEYGWSYDVAWDHLGDAMQDYKILADDWIKLKEENELIKKHLKD